MDIDTQLGNSLPKLFQTREESGKLELLKSLGGFYDELPFSPTGLNRFNIAIIPFLHPHFHIS